MSTLLSKREMQVTRKYLVMEWIDNQVAQQRKEVEEKLNPKLK